MHIGYRLHGHIYFLRKRKPSILMVEDARSYGFANTVGTSIGCINAFDLQNMKADEKAPDKAIDFVKEQISNNFEEYSQVYNFIDKNFQEIINPYFEKFSNELNELKNSLLRRDTIS